MPCRVFIALLGYGSGLSSDPKWLPNTAAVVAGSLVVVLVLRMDTEDRLSPFDLLCHLSASSEQYVLWWKARVIYADMAFQCVPLL